VKTEEVPVAKILKAPELIITRLVVLRWRARTRYTGAVLEMQKVAAPSKSSYGLIEKNAVKNSTQNTE
jgi:hypothetical protein